MRDVLRDLTLAGRAIRNEPAIMLTAMLTIGLAVGATTALLSVLHGVLLVPLPYRGASELVRVWEDHPGGTPAVPERLNALTVEVWSKRPQTLEHLASYGTREYTVIGPSGAERLTGAQLSPSIFGLLGVTAAAGRLFSETDASRATHRWSY